MKPKIKKMWVEALRSGEYKQGINALKTGNGKFCCLGVLTDLYCKTKKLSEARKEGMLSNFFTLPEEVVAWAGLESSIEGFNYDDNPKVEIRGVSHELSAVNDELPGFGFKRIANLIEKQL